MGKKKQKSENPAWPGADPTAPGGMSEKALEAELQTTHGYNTLAISEMNWPEKIDAVVAERKAREVEAKAEATKPKAEPMLVHIDGVNDYIFNGHKGAGPSASERWMTCTASLGATRAFLETLTPNQQAEFARSNESARQGSTAHAAAEVEARLMLGEITQTELDMTLLELTVNPVNPDEAYNEEMAEYITEYLDLVKQYADERGTESVLIESRVGAVVPLTGDHEDDCYEITGSADLIALPVPEHRTLVVGDLKYGNGLYVEVDENPQVRIYGLGALALLTNDDGELTVDVEEITYVIIQPRMGGIRTWTEKVDDLLDWRDEVLAPALTKALYGAEAGATFNPDPVACQFCPVRGTCSALAESVVSGAAELFDTVVESEFEGGEFPETASLSDERLGELLTQALSVTKIAKDLKAEAQRRLYRGTKVPGFGLVNYTPPRRWAEGADEALADEPGLWKKSLVTPTQALAAAKKAKDPDPIFAPYIEAPPKYPVVAPEGDRRQPWEGRAPEDMFEEEK